jgi:hypothetical protein
MYLEFIYIFKTSPNSVSEIIKHKVLSYANAGYRFYSYKEKELLVRYEIEGRWPVDMSVNKSYEEERHLRSVIGNTDPWTGSTWFFKNLEDANIQREKELKRIGHE